jgi:hypothetical protein
VYIVERYLPVRCSPRKLSEGAVCNLELYSITQIELAAQARGTVGSNNVQNV